MVKPKVLVIGGGFAGCVLAQNLSRTADVTLVDRKNYFETNYAALRALVEPSFAEKIVIPYTEVKDIGQFVQGAVVKLRDHEAELDNGQLIKFDFAAICSGSTYADTIGKGSVTDAKARIKGIQDAHALLKDAKSVLIAGGGAVGLELAGEIATEFPEKTVTLVHGGDRFLPNLKPNVGQDAANNLKQLGVKIVMQDKVSPSSVQGGAYRTEKGQEIRADIVYWCTGIKSNTDFMRADLSDCLDEQGRIKVEPSLQVTGHSTLFALGDVTDIPEAKLAFLAMKQGEMAAKNIMKAAAGVPSAKLLKWKPSMGMTVMVLSLGRNRGVGQVACCTFNGCFPRSVKSQGIYKLVADVRKQLTKA